MMFKVKLGYNILTKIKIPQWIFTNIRSTISDASLKDSNIEAQAEDRLVLKVVYPNGKLYKRLVKLSKLDSKIKLRDLGHISHGDIIGKTLPCKVVTSADHPVHFSMPTLEEFTDLMDKATATAVPHVAFKVLTSLPLDPGNTVLEAGSGSGLMTILLSQKVGNHGHISSYDIRHKSTPSQNWQNWKDVCNRLGQNVETKVDFETCDIAEAFDVVPQDMVLLDLPHIVSCMNSIVSMIKPGKCLIFYTPSISRVIDALDVAHKEGIPLVIEDVWEETDVKWSLFYKDGWKIYTPLQNEHATVFVAKFRYCPGYLGRSSKHSSSLDFQKVMERNNFKYGEQLMVSSVSKPKKIRKLKNLFTLREEKYFCNALGSLSCEKILQEPPGTVLTTSTGKQVYAYRPSILEIADMSETDVYSTRVYQLARSFLNISEDSQFLHVGPPSLKAILVASQLTRNFTLLHSSSKGTQCVLNPTQIAEKLKDNYNIDIQINLDASNRKFDGILVTNWDDSNLPLIFSSLKPGSYVCFISPIIHKLQTVLDWISQNNGVRTESLEVMEDRERRWLVRPVDVKNQMGRDLDTFICRPHYKMGKRPVFYLRVRAAIN